MQELIHHVWLSIRLTNIIAGQKTNKRNKKIGFIEPAMFSQNCICRINWCDAKQNKHVKFVSKKVLIQRTSSWPPIGTKSGSKSPCGPRHHSGVTSDQPSMVLASKTGQMWSQFIRNSKNSISSKSYPLTLLSTCASFSKVYQPLVNYSFGLSMGWHTWNNT